MKEFFEKIWTWITADILHMIGVGAGVLVILALIIFACVSSAKKRKKVKKAKAEIEARKAADAKAKEELAAKNAAELEERKAAEAKVKAELEAKREAEIQARQAAEAERVAAMEATKSAEETPVIEEIKDVKPVEEVSAPIATEKVEEKSAEPVKKAPAKKPAAKKTEGTKKLLGKWVIEFKQEKEYSGELRASNGEVMLSSEIYTTEEGARSGISTIKNTIATGNFVIYKDKTGNYYFKLKTANNRLLCVGEIYKTKDQCLKAVETVKRIAVDSPIADGVFKGDQYVKYTPEKVTSYEAKKGLTGKWKVEISDEGKYSAKLFASNGQLMLATEEVASKKGAETAIESVKKNSLAGNFIINKDKFGRFCYKLRNAQKSVICIGEAYESLDSCVKAIESVRRFAYTAIYSAE